MYISRSQQGRCVAVCSAWSCCRGAEELFLRRAPTVGRSGRHRVFLEVVGCRSAYSGYCFIVQIGSGDELKLGINVAA